MKISKLFHLIFLFATVQLFNLQTAEAQSGDQILDGIGETGMVARYVFNGDLKDWSRNTLHASAKNTGVKFINDKQFGRVLSLSGDQDSYLILPQNALADLESLSITGWILVRSKQPGQRFFDFGQNATKHFSAAPLGTTSQDGFQAVIAADKTNNKVALSKEVGLNKWVHLSIVIDIPSKSMVTYVDGQVVSETKDIPKELTAVFGAPSSVKNELYIGKSLSSTDPNLNALLHDFRIYN